MPRSNPQGGRLMPDQPPVTIKTSEPWMPMALHLSLLAKIAEDLDERADRARAAADHWTNVDFERMAFSEGLEAAADEVRSYLSSTPTTEDSE